MNKKIIVSALVITGAGVVHSITSKPPKAITPTVMGGYVFLLMLSLMDMIGGDLSKIAGGLSMVAVVYVLINVFPWSLLIGAVQGK
jgi:hypothetical protein